MIFVFLAILIVALIIANILVAVAKPKKGVPRKKIYSEETVYATPVIDSGAHERLEETMNTLAEKNFEFEAATNANTQKINLLNTRLSTIEKTVSVLAHEQLNGKETITIRTNEPTQEDIDLKSLVFNNRKKRR